MDVTSWYAQGKTKNINGHDVFYKRDGRGEPLFCIHGFPSSSWDFDPLWSELTSHFDAVASDLIGLGRSAKPKIKLTIALQADVIEQLALDLKIQTAHIFAHDLGDTVAQELLARQHNNTSLINWKSCVFLNGGLFPETHRPRLIQKLLISPLGGLISKLVSKKTFVKNMNSIFSKEHPPEKDFLDETWNLLIENDGISMMPRLIRYMDERKEFRNRWVAPLVQNVIPIRFINGIDDPISGLHAAKRFEEIIPNPDVVLIQNSGHYPHVETPNEVREAFFDFHKNLDSQK